MSIATEIIRITGAKSALKTAINGKGGTVTDAMLLDAYAAQIDALSSSGGSAEYYRCASVDTAAKTWTGYKAVLTDGVYAFASSVTTGLTYTSVTPVVGSIYSADALAYIGSLYQGFYLLSPTDALANTFTNYYGTWTFTASSIHDIAQQPYGLFGNDQVFTFGVESTHWLLAECSESFVPTSLYFYAGGSLLQYTPKDMEIYGVTELGNEVLLANGAVELSTENFAEATFEFDSGGVAYKGIKIKQTTNQTGQSVQAIWRQIRIYGYTA